MLKRTTLAVVVGAMWPLAAVPAPARAATGLEGVPAFGHVFLIVGENTSLSELNKTNAPYQLGWVRQHSAWLTNYWAISHYSTSNYIAMTSGQFLPCHQADEKPATCNQNVNNLFHQLDVVGVSWLEWSGRSWTGTRGRRTT